MCTENNPSLEPDREEESSEIENTVSDEETPAESPTEMQESASAEIPKEAPPEMPPERTDRPENRQLDEGIYPWQAVLCYAPGMFWLPVIFNARSRYLWHHASQGFRLTLLAMLEAGVLALAALIVPPSHTVLLNQGTSFAVEVLTGEGQMLMTGIVLTVVFVLGYLMLCGAINAVGGTYNTLPIIGKIGFGTRKKAKKK